MSIGLDNTVDLAGEVRLALYEYVSAKVFINWKVALASRVKRVLELLLR